jgi:hypothetical protein
LQGRDRWGSSNGARIGFIDCAPGRQEKIRSKVVEAKAQDLLVETLLLSEFVDKVTVINRRPDFHWGRNAFQSELGRIQLLRTI